jgi:hypothetical protein
MAGLFSRTIDNTQGATQVNWHLRAALVSPMLFPPFLCSLSQAYRDLDLEGSWPGRGEDALGEQPSSRALGTEASQPQQF